MGEFKRRESRSGSRFSRPKRFSPSRGRDRDSGSSYSGRGRSDSRESFEATCAKCGNQCDLPFKPKTSKPVYCRDCFKKGGDSETRTSNPSEQFDKINEKLDKILSALHKD